MPKVTLEEAAAAVGVHRTTIWRHVKRGRVSAAREPGGAWVIDASELARAYGVRPPQPPAIAESADASAPLRAPIASEVEWLRSRVEALEADRARLLELLERAHERLLTDRRPWWRRWFARDGA